ncbi:Tigger transposable element-derived protein 1, partial [Anthophora retusa]
MSQKRRNCSIDTNKKKLGTHKLHTIETKMETIKRSENGESFASIGRLYGVNRSTICSILKNKSKIKEYVQNCGNISSKIVSKRHGIVMDEMERSLSSWIDDQHQNNVPLSFSIIQAKALSLHEDWKTRLNEDSNTVFQASNGWFDKFKMRYSLHNIKFTGESADADKDAAKEFISSLSKIIEDGEYSPSQIFNVDETGLFWKKMPNRTFLSKEESVAPGYKPSKNRLTLLLGGNLAGDLKLKPLLVYQAENPRALKGKDKELLPVIMTKAIKATDRQDGATLTDFWKNYNIWNAINNIGDSWAEIKESTMKGSWKQLCPEMMSDFINFEETPETLTDEIFSVMNELNLDVNKEDVNELIESHSAPLSNEYLIEQQLSNSEIHNESEEEEADKNVKTLTIKNMNEAFTHLDKFLTIMEEYDPNGERISQVRRAIEKDTACYRNLYQEKKKKGSIQLTLDKFIKETPESTNAVELKQEDWKNSGLEKVEGKQRR